MVITRGSETISASKGIESATVPTTAKLVAMEPPTNKAAGGSADYTPTSYRPGANLNTDMQQSTSSKSTKWIVIVLIVVMVSAAGYLGFKWYKGK